jgi:hypothetical protein
VSILYVRASVVRVAMSVVCLGIGAVSPPSAAADPAYTLKVETDCDSALYEVNQSATFLITVARGNEEVHAGSVSYFCGRFSEVRQSGRVTGRDVETE